MRESTVQRGNTPSPPPQHTQEQKRPHWPRSENTKAAISSNTAPVAKQKTSFPFWALTCLASLSHM